MKTKRAVRTKNRDSETPTREALADALRISEREVYRCARRGMPVGNLEAARRWRDANVVPRHGEWDGHGPTERELLHVHELYLAVEDALCEMKLPAKFYKVVEAGLRSRGMSEEAAAEEIEILREVLEDDGRG